MAGSTDGPGSDRATVRLGVTGTARHLAAAVRLCWSAAPGVLLTQLLLTVLAGVWVWMAALLTRAIVDRLTAAPAAPAAPDASLMLLAVGLGALGIAVGTEAAVSRYLDAALERALRVVVTTRLYGAVNRLAGLARLENPRSGTGSSSPRTPAAPGPASRQRRARRRPGGPDARRVRRRPLGCRAGDGGGGVRRRVPTLWVEIALGRRRAAMTWRIGHAERREFFYASC